MKRILVSGFLMGTIFVCVVLAGPEFVEPGKEDAGSVPNTAANPAAGVTGQLLRISGKLNGFQAVAGPPAPPDFEDMYLIFISDPEAFSATTVDLFGGFAEFDTRLYLFDADGFGLLGNDDTFVVPSKGGESNGSGSGGGFIVSGSTLGNFSNDGSNVNVIEPGLYFLAITVSPRGPQSDNGSMFEIPGKIPPIPQGSAPKDTSFDSPLGKFGKNIPPIPVNLPPGNTVTIDAGAGETLDLKIGFQSPEQKQITTVVINDPNGAQLAGLNIINNPGQIASMKFQWRPTLDDLGTYQLQLTATDDGFPSESTSVTITINITGAEVSGPDGPGGNDPVTGWDGFAQGVPGLYEILLAGVSFPAIEASIDLRPGHCPNVFNRNGNGFFKAAIAGDIDFDAAQIDITTILIARADGIGGSIGPNLGPSGPEPKLKDKTSPVETDDCFCIEADKDEIIDLVFRFSRSAMTKALMLDEFQQEDLVELVVTGELLDGTPFIGFDCVEIDGGDDDDDFDDEFDEDIDDDDDIDDD